MFFVIVLFSELYPNFVTFFLMIFLMGDLFLFFLFFFASAMKFYSAAYGHI